MCAISESEPRALVCDLALPLVRSALAAAPNLAVEFEPRPGDGTEVRLTVGDATIFDQRVRDAIAQANR